MDQNIKIIEDAIKGSLNIIEQGREQEIISRRFGLKGQRETLEQIGEMLNITRERVRQLEKAIVIRLTINAEEGTIPELQVAEKLLIRHLTEAGRIACVSDIAEKLYGHAPTAQEKAQLIFLAGISSHLTLIEETDKYHSAIGIGEYGDIKAIKTKIDEIVQAVRNHKEPLTIEQLDAKLNYEHPSHVAALASVSKNLATLNNLWGLSKWPSVNPRNIRDKIFVVLENNKQPMHFSDIAKAIKNSNFKRRDVTIQAIHNELIKDKRFILIGRGIYALDSWGYIKGTVSDIIYQILDQANQPLSKEEIVKRVLHTRKVKETTILLNLQNKNLFQKIDKNTYTHIKKP